MDNVTSSDLERVDSHYAGGLNKFGTGEVKGVSHDEWTFDSARLEQVWVVAHFSELHKHIHDAEEVRIHKRALSLVIINILIIKQTLSSA